ncbi:MAG: hypothetical protein ACRBN8_45550 [Nannocystales bacterium]
MNSGWAVCQARRELGGGQQEVVARDDLFVRERIGVGVEGADPAGEELVDGVRDGDVAVGVDAYADRGDVALAGMIDVDGAALVDPGDSEKLSVGVVGVQEAAVGVV